MVLPIRKNKHQKQWPHRSRQVYPVSQDGVRLVGVRPKKVEYLII